MSILDQLKKVKLNKVETQDRSKPLLQSEFTEEEINKYQKDTLFANMENYYDLIQDFTFPTKFVPLTQNHAKFFIRLYEKFYKNKSQELILDESEVKEIDAIVEYLQPTFEEMKGTNDYVFIKSSSRSAKDSPIYKGRFYQMFSEKMGNYKELTVNNMLKSIQETGFQLLKVYKLRDLLIEWGTSNRICEDMKLALDHTDQWNQNFVVRTFFEIPSDMEFRGFVKNGKLNALSQYNHVCFYEPLVELKEQIGNVCREMFEKKIQPQLEEKYSDYIIDFCFVDGDLAKPKIIELNPFQFSTDGCLFSWKTERNILENGPFEFRILENIIEGVELKMGKKYRDLMNRYKKDKEKK
ncbi:cell division cycle protein 123 [Anaeramoeba flamelloides]|uniref:Cell division cycle protein 123 n=1 Tax=Anaeramoeba flamelloides TaxID=1746091 RepID=A0AAV7YE85_9EUKA|nr:cell division cycle protein 123 [Anaeramoeba flamelloides]